MNRVILVARRPDGGRRDQLWAYCESRWRELLGWPIIVGEHTADEGPFSYSTAINRAARDARPFDVAIVIGADWTFHDPEVIATAASSTRAHGKLVFAHTGTVVLTEQATDWLIRQPAGLPLDGVAIDGTVHPNTYSGILAVTGEMWGMVGGFDERFVGWGWEDHAFWSACCALGGGFERVKGRIYHLWHPTDRAEREDSPYHPANQVLGERYLAAKWNRPAMLGILGEPGGPLA